MICRIVRPLQSIIRYSSHSQTYLSSLNKQIYHQFATPKKQKDTQVKPKTYNIKDIDEIKLPQHLKQGYRIHKQTFKMQVASEGELQNSIIIAQIIRQRTQIQQNNQQSQPKSQQTKKSQNYVQKFLFGVTGINFGLTVLLSLPIFGNSAYWLGVYSTSLLYPSFICVTSISLGINLAYMILRQGLCMHTKIQDIKNINITKSPLSYCLQMCMLSLQLFSLAISVSLPITLLGLQQNYRNIGLYGILLCILSINAHNSYQQKSINNPNYKMSIQAICFIVMFLLSSYIHLEYTANSSEQQQVYKKTQKFKEGQKRIKQIWRIKRFALEKNQKITDIIQDNTQTNTIQGSKIGEKQPTKKKIWQKN